MVTRISGLSLPIFLISHLVEHAREEEREAGNRNSTCKVEHNGNVFDDDGHADLNPVKRQHAEHVVHRFHVFVRKSVCLHS